MKYCEIKRDEHLAKDDLTEVWETAIQYERPAEALKDTLVDYYQLTEISPEEPFTEGTFKITLNEDGAAIAETEHATLRAKPLELTA